MSPTRLVALAAVLLVSTLSAQQPRQPPPSREQIARWVKQLGHDDFAVREQATLASPRRLIRLSTRPNPLSGPRPKAQMPRSLTAPTTC